jgi:multiple sugar transport system substrate-binding protein
MMRWSSKGGVLALVATLGIAGAACSGGSGGGITGTKAVTHDKNATMLVWTDATRKPGFDAFQKSHPDVKMKVEVYDPTTLLSKIQLFNRTGSGWPDVVFDPNPDDVAQLSSSSVNFTADLGTLIPKTVLDGFGTSNDVCKVDAQLRCIKNDLAQSVLWYNAKLMKQFGYTVPKTWDQYRALGDEVAKQHPGYIIGTAGFTTIYNDFLWSSGCPVADVTSANKVTINMSDPKCTRVADLLDPLLANGSVSREGPFDPEVIKLGKEQKILMMPGASWYGDFVFKPPTSYATPNGVLAAAPYPSWSGESTNWSGNTGGGIYLVSRHSKNTQGAAEVIQWMATDPAYQTTAPTYPAYGPAAKAWANRLSTDKFYNQDPFPVLQEAAGKIDPLEKPVRYAVGDAVTATLAATIRGGGTVSAGLPKLQSQLRQLAQAAGYAVATS